MATTEIAVTRADIEWLLEGVEEQAEVTHTSLTPFLKVPSLEKRDVTLLTYADGKLRRDTCTVAEDALVELPSQLSGDFEGLVFVDGIAVAYFQSTHDTLRNVSYSPNRDVNQSDVLSQFIAGFSGSNPSKVTTAFQQQLLDVAALMPWQSAALLSTAPPAPSSLLELVSNSVDDGAVNNRSSLAVEPTAASTTAAPSPTETDAANVSPKQMLDDLKAAYSAWWPRANTKASRIKKYVGAKAEPTSNSFVLPFAQQVKQCKNNQATCVDTGLELHIYPFLFDGAGRRELKDYHVKETLEMRDPIPWESIATVYKEWNTKYCSKSTPALMFLICFLVNDSVQFAVETCMHSGNSMNKKTGQYLYRMRERIDQLFENPRTTYRPASTLKEVLAGLPGKNQRKRLSDPGSSSAQTTTMEPPPNKRQRASAPNAATLIPASPQPPAASLAAPSDPIPIDLQMMIMNAARRQSASSTTAPPSAPRRRCFVVYQDEVDKQILLEKLETPSGKRPSIEFTSTHLKMRIKLIMWLFRQPEIKNLAVNLDEDGLFYVNLEGEQRGTTFAAVVHSGDDDLELIQNRALKNSTRLRLPTSKSTSIIGAVFREDESGDSGELIAYFELAEQESEQSTTTVSASHDQRSSQQTGRDRQGSSGSASSSSSAASASSSFSMTPFNASRRASGGDGAFHFTPFPTDNTTAVSSSFGATVTPLQLKQQDEHIIIAYLNGECLGEDQVLQPHFLQDKYQDVFRGTSRVDIWKRIHHTMKLYEGGANEAIERVDQSVIVAQLVKSCFIVRNVRKAVNLLSKYPQILNYQMPDRKTCEQVLEILLFKYTQWEADETIKEKATDPSFDYYQYLQLLFLVAKVKCENESLPAIAFVNKVISKVNQRTNQPVMAQPKDRTLMMKLCSLFATKESVPSSPALAPAVPTTLQPKVEGARSNKSTEPFAPKALSPNQHGKVPPKSEIMLAVKPTPNIARLVAPPPPPPKSETLMKPTKLTIFENERATPPPHGAYDSKTSPKYTLFKAYFKWLAGSSKADLIQSYFTYRSKTASKRQAVPIWLTAESKMFLRVERETTELRVYPFTRDTGDQPTYLLSAARTIVLSKGYYLLREVLDTFYDPLLGLFSSTAPQLPDHFLLSFCNDKTTPHLFMKMHYCKGQLSQISKFLLKHSMYYLFQDERGLKAPSKYLPAPTRYPNGKQVHFIYTEDGSSIRLQQRGDDTVVPFQKMVILENDNVGAVPPVPYAVPFTSAMCWMFELKLPKATVTQLVKGSYVVQSTAFQSYGKVDVVLLEYEKQQLTLLLSQPVSHKSQVMVATEDIEGCEGIIFYNGTGVASFYCDIST